MQYIYIVYGGLEEEICEVCHEEDEANQYALYLEENNVPEVRIVKILDPTWAD
ncbi:hypothetical protein V2H45_18415 [Tumidithrix elongata RA019]|uniref:Uncharacterized protein n=1 Tax=Tumidithrix elongata BACA0141 TaxID=2716417 RepID=A0AAW9Q5K7_9CYAN|nr:hypothetical protein [Tumidithrix elongata RA019]